MIELPQAPERSDIGSIQESIVMMILKWNPHLSLGDPMRGPIDAFIDGQQIDFASIKDPHELENRIVMARSSKITFPLNPNQMFSQEESFVGKFLHVYSCSYVHHEKVAMLKRHMGQMLVCIHPETFDKVNVKIDEEVISRFNYVIFRYAISV